jgi:hypothetical protein
MIDPRLVVLRRDPSATGYPTHPFSPSEAYPEYRWAAAPGGIAREPNRVYALFRETLHGLGLDRERFGTPQWNPLREFVRPGQNIVIKPNFVQHFHGHGQGTDVLLTHGALIRAALDYAMLALTDEAGRLQGHLAVGDAPLQRGDFPRILGIVRLPEIQAFYAAAGGPAFDVVDFRRERALIDEHNWMWARTRSAATRPVTVRSRSTGGRSTPRSSRITGATG